MAPINLCPPVPNENLPCPPPVGALTPWHPSPTEPVNLSLPEPRTDGGAVQVGEDILYVGGSDGESAQSTVFVAQAIPWAPSAPGRRGRPCPSHGRMPPCSSRAATCTFSGADADGNPADRSSFLKPNPETGSRGEWEAAEDAHAAEPRAGAGVAATATGLVPRADRPGRCVWHGLTGALNDQGTLDEWQESHPFRSR